MSIRSAEDTPCIHCTRYRRRQARLLWAVAASAVLLPLATAWIVVAPHAPLAIGDLQHDPRC